MDEVFLNLFRDFGLGGGAFILALGMLVAILLMFVRNARLKNETAAHESKVRADMAAEAQRQQEDLQTKLLKMLEDSTQQIRDDSRRHEEDCRTQLDDIQKRFDAYEAAAESEKTELRTALDNLADEKEALKKRVSELAVQLQNIKLLHTAERKQNADLMAANAELLQVNNTLSKTNRDQAEQILDYKGKIDKLNEQVSKLERENQTLNDRIQELAQQVQQLTAGQSVNHNQSVEPKQE